MPKKDTFTKDNRKKNYHVRQNKRNNKRDSADVPNDRTGRSTNDSSWYTTNPDLARAAGTLNFVNPIGLRFDHGFGSLNHPNTDIELPRVNSDDFASIPGIYALITQPSAGYSNSPDSALNIASNAVYSFIRHANSGHSNYDSVDLMLYLLANTQIYSYLNFLVRVYRCSTLYSGRNRYLPSHLLHAQDVDYDDVIRNLANFRYGIDNLIIKAQSMAVPANMTIFARHAFMYTNIYAEGVSTRDQIYMYNPGAFWKFALDDDGAGCLTLERFFTYGDGRGHTVEELLNFGHTLLDAFITDEDMNIMSGDILKAYGVDGILKLNTISDLTPITPIFDPVVLTQMKNAKIVPTDVRTWVAPNVYQSEDKSYLKCTPGYKLDTGVDRLIESLTVLRSDALISSISEDPSVDEVLEITRMIPSAHYLDTYDGNPFVGLATGTEIVTDVRVFYNDLEPDTFFDCDYVLSWTSLDVSKSALIARLSHFKYHHEVMLLEKLSDSEMNYHGSIFDVDNYTVQSHDIIARIHDAVLMNMLAVPSVAAFSTVRKQ